MESEKEFVVTKITFAKKLSKLIRGYSERYKTREIDRKKVRGLIGVDFYEGAGLEMPGDAASEDSNIIVN